MRALVVNAQRNGLGVVRALGERNIDVIAVDHRFYAPGLHSRFASANYTVVGPSVDEPGFVDEIAAIGRREASRERIYLLPMNDEYVWAFCRYWPRLAPYFIPVFNTDFDVLQACLDKTQLCRIAEREEVPVPRTVYSPASADDLDTLNPPLIVKPGYRRTPEAMQRGVFRLRECTDRNQARLAAEELEAAGQQYVVQEIVPGGDSELYTVGLVALEGEVAALFTGRKLRQFPPNFGECALGEIVEAPAAEEYSRRLVRATGFTGIAQIEFKQHDGTYYLMEINPRSWSWNSLATYAGVNLPATAIAAIRDGITAPPIYPTRTVGRWSFYEMDALHNVVLHRNLSWAAWFRDARNADCYAYWQADDPMPCVWSLFITARDWARKLRATRRAARSVNVSPRQTSPQTDTATISSGG